MSEKSCRADEEFKAMDVYLEGGPLDGRTAITNQGGSEAIFYYGQSKRMPVELITGPNGSFPWTILIHRGEHEGTYRYLKVNRITADGMPIFTFMDEVKAEPQC